MPRSGAQPEAGPVLVMMHRPGDADVTVEADIEAHGVGSVDRRVNETTDVVLLGPQPAEVQQEDAEATLDARLRALRTTSSLRDAVDQASAETGLPRRRVYKRALELEREELEREELEREAPERGDEE